MKRSFLNIVVFVTLMSMLFSCGRGKAKIEGLWTVEIEYRSSSPLDSVWYLYTYGSKSVEIDTLFRDTLQGLITFARTFERDTLDVCILYDNDGNILAPIFPDPQHPKTGIRLDKKTPKVRAYGMLYPEAITTWMSFMRDTTLTDSIHTDSLAVVLSSMLRHKVGAMICTHYGMFGDTSEIANTVRDVGREIIFQDRDLLNVLGTISGKIAFLNPYTNHQSVGKLLPIEIKDKKGTSSLKVSRLAKKKGLALYQFTTLYRGDSLSTAIAEKVIKKMDSLKIPLVTTLIEADKLPKGWKSHPITQVAKTPSYFIVDSIGNATDFAAQCHVHQLPTYLLVDTLGMIRAQWHEADSVFAHFAKKEKK